MRPKQCKDCGSDSKRPAPHPGPRCATHHRVRRNANKVNAWAKRLEKVYDITAEQYADILAHQGGKCYICQRATGATKRLAVDHDHKTGLIRGIACSVCNSMLAHARDDIEVFVRAARYLKNPPAQEIGIYAVHEDNRDS